VGSRRFWETLGVQSRRGLGTAGSCVHRGVHEFPGVRGRVMFILLSPGFQGPWGLRTPGVPRDLAPQRPASTRLSLAATKTKSATARADVVINSPRTFSRRCPGDCGVFNHHKDTHLRAFIYTRWWDRADRQFGFPRFVP